MYGMQGKLLVVDLAAKTAEVRAVREATLKKYKGIDALAEKFLKNDDIVIMTGSLTGLLGPCTNRYGIYCGKGKNAPKGSLAGFFGAELKLCGYDGMMIRGKAKSPVYITIQDAEIKFRSASALAGKNVDAKTAAIAGKFPVKAGVLVIGPAAEKGCGFAAVIGDRLYSGPAGSGAAFAAKNLVGIVANGSGVIETAEPAKYWDLAMAARKKAAQSKFAIALGSADARVSRAAAENLQARPLAGYRNLERRLDWDKEEPVSVVRRRGCYSCAIGCRKQYKIEIGKYKGVVESPAPEFAGVFEDECLVKDTGALLRAYELCRKNGMDPAECAAFAGKALRKARCTGNAKAMLDAVKDAVSGGKRTKPSAASGYGFAAVRNQEALDLAMDRGMCPFAAVSLNASELKALTAAAEGKE